MADIFQEVDEALRQDRAKEWWDRHGSKVIGGVVALILAIAAWNGWTWYQTSARGKAGMAFSAAVESASKDRAASIAALEKLTSGVEPYASLARLKVAQLTAEGGDHAAAATQFAGAGQSLASADLRELSVLLGVMQSFDSAAPDDLQARLQPLTARERPWRSSALEMMAAVAMKRQDMPAARALLTELRDDPATPPAMRERARELLAVLGGDGGEKKT
ncbi:MAG: tetratricopeptide repeat protein [Alphaproteobacteria bacterium]|nr:tetratricopeptide repeat protein [Alphaproteobacteria bacterium]